MGVKAGGSAYVDSDRKKSFEMWFKIDHMNLIMVRIGGGL